MEEERQREQKEPRERGPSGALRGAPWCMEAADLDLHLRLLTLTMEEGP